MTKRDLRIRCFPFVRFLSTGSAPSLMRLRHFNLSRVSSFQFNCRLQNSPYFCVFKHARAVKQKVWNEAKNRERDWGRERLARFAPRFTDFFTDFAKKTDCFAV